MNTTDDEVLAKAAEKLDALKDNVHILEYENLHNYILSGDISIAYTFTPFIVLSLDANPDLQIAFPEGTMGFGVDACFIPVNAPHAKNANLFLQFLLRPEIGASITEWQHYCCTQYPRRAKFWANPIRKTRCSPALLNAWAIRNTSLTARLKTSRNIRIFGLNSN